MRDRLEKLYDAYMDATLSKEEEKELCNLLKDLDNQVQWRRFSTLEGKLQEELAGGMAEACTVHKLAKPLRWIIVPAVAAALLLAITAWWVLRPFGADEGAFKVVAGTGRVELLRGSKVVSLKPGKHLFPGDTLATHERAALRVASISGSVVLDIGTDSSLIVNGEGYAKLNIGSVACMTAKQDAGTMFRIDTPHAVVSVVGTKLSVLADPFATRLNVYEGKVRFKRIENDAQEVTVHAGSFALATLHSGPLISRIAESGEKGEVIWSDSFEGGLSSLWQFENASPSCKEGPRKDGATWVMRVVPVNSNFVSVAKVVLPIPMGRTIAEYDLRVDSALPGMQLGHGFLPLVREGETVLQGKIIREDRENRYENGKWYHIRAECDFTYSDDGGPVVNYRFTRNGNLMGEETGARSAPCGLLFWFSNASLQISGVNVSVEKSNRDMTPIF